MIADNTDDESLEGWRVKLYQLECEGSWLDQGTGFVECKYVPSIRAPALIINSEGNTEVLLQSKIQCEDIYERQGGEFNSIFTTILVFLI